MDLEGHRIQQMVDREFPGHTVIFHEGETGDDSLHFVIRDGAGTIVSRGSPSLLRSEVRKWSDSDLRAVIRLLIG